MFYGDLLVNKVIWHRSINSHLYSSEMSFGGGERLRNEVYVPNPQFVTLCTRAAAQMFGGQRHLTFPTA